MDNMKNTYAAYYSIFNALIMHMRDNDVPWPVARKMTTAAIDDLYDREMAHIRQQQEQVKSAQCAENPAGDQADVPEV